MVSAAEGDFAMRTNFLFQTFMLCATTLTVLLMIGTLTSRDAIQRLFDAGISGIGVCLLAPSFVGLVSTRRRPVATIMAVVAITGVLYLNAWACKVSGTFQTSPLDQIEYLLLSYVFLSSITSMLSSQVLQS